MIHPSDFIHLTYTRDLTEGGIVYALQSLPHIFPRTDNSTYDRLRKIVADAAVELAFRRYLSECEIPFDVQGAAPFTEPNHYDVALAGKRCDIQSFFISRREQALQIKRNPQILLHVPALVASDQNAAEEKRNSDIYLFAFFTGLLTTSQADLQKVMETHQPHYFVHLMPEAWMRPKKWNPLGKLVLKSDSDASQRLEIGGQEAGGAIRSLEVEIPPRRRVEIEEGFFSLAYIHTHDVPKSRIGIHCPTKKETYVIPESDWSNLWVYGMDILLAGYLTRQEFNQRASFVREGARVFQYDRTRTKNLAVNVADLKPIAELLESANQWKL